MSTLISLAAPTGRTLLALIFVMSGMSKIPNYAGIQAYMESAGIPGMMLPLVIVLELVGGLAVVLGWKTRLAALLLAGFSLLSALLFHADFSDQTQMTMFLKNLAIAGGFLLLVANGAGDYSLDNRNRS
jgi:putative oxidoreductase